MRDDCFCVTPMYLPNNFREPSVPVMHELMRDFPLATLITHDENGGGLTANHIPLLLDAEPAPLGTLRGHVARANPLWQTARDTDVLVLFHGPQSYISPSWYATKTETGKVVPTWNYAVVHAHGVLRVRDDAAWLRAQLESLTNANEAAFDAPWSVSDAPPDYTDGLIKAIVGIEVEITKLSGKWKVSQNQPVRNQEGVINGLSAISYPDAPGMAGLVKARIKD